MKRPSIDTVRPATAEEMVAIAADITGWWTVVLTNGTRIIASTKDEAQQMAVDYLKR